MKYLVIYFILSAALKISSFRLPLKAIKPFKRCLLLDYSTAPIPVITDPSQLVPSITYDLSKGIFDGGAVIARIWDGGDETVSGFDVGHVSLELDGTYISLYPGGTKTEIDLGQSNGRQTVATDSATYVPNVFEDCKSMEKAPTWTLPLYNIDVAKVRKTFLEMKAANNIKWTVAGEFSEKSTSGDGKIFHSCASIVLALLRDNGINNYLSDGLKIVNPIACTPIYTGNLLKIAALEQLLCSLPQAEQAKRRNEIQSNMAHFRVRYGSIYETRFKTTADGTIVGTAVVIGSDPLAKYKKVADRPLIGSSILNTVFSLTSNPETVATVSGVLNNIAKWFFP